jgi:4-amino-4-deoxy-L-arabinose transferase-like glycosyltransferase
MRPRDGWLLAVLAVGLLESVAVFTFQNPLNNDSHLPVVRYVLEHHRLARADEMNQAYHPPLYYLLAAPWLGLGGLKVLQLFSLLTTLATKCVYYVGIRDLEFLGSRRARAFLLALGAWLPQLTLHGNFVSNDPLAFLIGALVFVQAWRCLDRPTLGRCAALGLLLGLGLLTKGVFLAFLAPLAVFVALVLYRSEGSARRTAVGVAAFVLIALGVGSYKFVENAIAVGNPFFNNLDLGQRWVAAQRPTFVDAASYLTLDLPGLIRNPTISSASAHSMTTMLYGSFWYQFVPESNLAGNLSRLRVLAGPIYVLGLVPTALLALGLLRALASAVALLRGRIVGDSEWRRALFEVLPVALFGANLALVVGVGIQYDVWSVYQSRLVFPSLFGALVAIHLGLEVVERHRWTARATYAALAALLVLFLAYFFAEASYVVRHPVDPSVNLHLPYRVRMK